MKAIVFDTISKLVLILLGLTVILILVGTNYKTIAGAFLRQTQISQSTANAANSSNDCLSVGYNCQEECDSIVVGLNCAEGKICCE